MSKTIKLNGVFCVLEEENVRIVDCYKIKLKDAEEFCLKLHLTCPHTYERSCHSWAVELRAHIILWYFGLFSSHVIDADLNDNESKFRLLMYHVIDILFSRFIKESN